MKNTITAIAKEVMEIVNDKIVLLESSEKPALDGFNMSTKYEVSFLIQNETAFRMLSAAFNFTAVKVGNQEYPMIFMMSQLEYKGVLTNIDVSVDAGTVGAKLLAEVLEERKEKPQLTPKFIEFKVNEEIAFIEDLHSINSVDFHQNFGDYRHACFIINYKSGNPVIRSGDSEEESKNMYNTLKEALFNLNNGVKNETTD